jgi:peptide/nickel transport system ATP-binding protein
MVLDDGGDIMTGQIGVAETGQAESGPGPVVEVSAVVKRYRLRGAHGRTVHALDGVSLTVGRRRTYGLVGESGSGKTTLGQVLLRLEHPDSGRITFDGQDWLAKRGERLRKARKEIQAIFQDPGGSLDPRRTAGYAIGEALAAHGLAGDKAARARRATELLDMVGLPAEVAWRHPAELSGGQRQRVTIARAIAVGPKFVICDEPTSALDVSVQAQILNLLSDLQESLGVSYLFISHSLAAVRHIADRVGVMYLGKIVEEAPATRLFSAPQHPYTIALLAAIPVPDPGAAPARQGRGGHLGGEVPSATVLPSGCRFRLRCPRAQDVCAEREPPLSQVSAGHAVACHFPGPGALPCP